MKTKLRMIAISEPNYQALKALGCTGESFNDVITTILRKVGKLSFDNS
jgi:predicted CopG family antitoxin